MLEHKATNDPSAIETLFCEPFGKLPVREMTQDEQKVFITVMTAENNGNGDTVLNAIPKKEIPTAVEFIQKSLKHRFTFELNQCAQLMVGQIMRSFGEGVMYLTYLQYKAKKMGKQKLTVNDLSHIFPMGFPTNDALRDIWDSQKVKREKSGQGDNLLDYQSALQSIHFERPKNTKSE